jgi:Alginate lyase
MLTRLETAARALVWQRLLVICIALLVAANPALAQRPATFAHPGLLATQKQLDGFKAAVNAEQPNAIKEAYQLVQDDPRSSSAYRPTPTAVVEVTSGTTTAGETAIKGDAMAAYLNALQWVKSGDARHRDKAVEILNAWAATFQSIRAVKTDKGGSLKQAALEASWTLPVWLNAAEIIRHHGQGAARWPPQDIAAFDRFASKLYEESRKAQGRKSNWGAAAAMAAMALGVYQNDQVRYAQGLQQTKALLQELVSPDGEVFELRSRDCGHPQFTLTAFVQAAAIASNQGDSSVWLTGNQGGAPALARGLEYMATALTQGSSARDCRVNGGLPGAVLSGYANIAILEYGKLKVPLPRFSEAVRAKGLDGASGQFVGWSGVMYGRP